MDFINNRFYIRFELGEYPKSFGSQSRFNPISGEMDYVLPFFRYGWNVNRSSHDDNDNNDNNNNDDNIDTNDNYDLDDDNTD